MNKARRDELVAPKGAIGADAVLVDGPDLAERAAPPPSASPTAWPRTRRW